MDVGIGGFARALKADAKQCIHEKIRIALPNGIVETDTHEKAAQVPSYAEALNQRKSVDWPGMPGHSG
ncbi:MAG: hypothetical protein GZ093_11665 [Rhodoferax sp.]|uniref:hypothetical protein n=1 Tax=Rhodoferax sp. TaxID=50421 RepID=UPI00140053B8|nr:hypothetical protein [Rhodoferax sp.]NDP39388.1 hypothetical protein [Rhodoferax sp.]